MTKDILIVICTHGNEKIGPEVVKILKQKGLGRFFDCLLANPKASRANKRFIERDLNRSYPGKRRSQFYEERKAYYNLQIAKRYKYVIDLHEAPEGKDDFIIIPRKAFSGGFPLEGINLQKVILWPDPKGPLGDVLESAIELEFGSKNRERREMIEKAIDILENFFLGRSFSEKEFFYVYGKLFGGDFKEDIALFCDFKEIKIGKEKFLPLLVGQYLKEGIICYKMKKVI